MKRRKSLSLAAIATGEQLTFNLIWYGGPVMRNPTRLTKHGFRNGERLSSSRKMLLLSLLMLLGISAIQALRLAPPVMRLGSPARSPSDAEQQSQHMARHSGRGNQLSTEPRMDHDLHPTGRNAAEAVSAEAAGRPPMTRARAMQRARAEAQHVGSLTRDAAPAAGSPMAEQRRTRPAPYRDEAQWPAPNRGAPQTTVQGGSLRTFSGATDNVEINLGTNGRPMDATVEVWEGPGNTPVQMRAYGDDGAQRPINAVVGGTRRSAYSPTPKTVAIRNTGPMEFPISGAVAPAERPAIPLHSLSELSDAAIELGLVRPDESYSRSSKVIQGDSHRTYGIDGIVDSVQVLITSDGYPVYARIEILQGPSCVRSGIELYTDNGAGRPILYTLETPGYGCVIEIHNTGPMEYPVTALVVPKEINRYKPSNDEDFEVVIGGTDSDFHGRRRRSGRYAAQDYHTVY